MTLTPGTRFGPYEISSPLGAGGMGEVYRARDTRLDRTVALKILPLHRAASADARQRFEREAKAISALNHPHICVLHDVGQQEGVDFLVMEYLEGETLADRLKRGAVPLGQVLRFAVEVAEALDTAHRQGIIHRDLKPGNMMLTKSGTKLLDFGVAKLCAPGGHLSGASESSPTETQAKPLTEEGDMVGTLQYMAPEQLDGREPDARTDIFAFGTVLYEMATRRRAFGGKDRTGLIVAILTSDPPPISTLRPLTPPALDRAVATCLAKDPDDRWQTAHDLATELRWIAESGAQAGVPARVAAPRGSRFLWAAAMLASALMGGALVFGLTHRGERAEKPVQVRLEISPPDKAALHEWDVPAVSPDGGRIAFSASIEGKRHVYVRALSSLAATRVPGTDGGIGPFWSPDGRQIGFFAQEKLKRVDLSGGPAQALCDMRSFFCGASWSHEGTIVFSDSVDLFRVAVGGGEPTRLGKRAEGETNRCWPHFLPDGRRYLYLSRALRPEDQGIYVASLESDERRRIVASDHNAAYSPSGHLLFVSGSALTAQPFDVSRLELSGEAFPVAEQVALIWPPFPGAAYSVSASGVLAWRTGFAETQLTWFDRTGRTLGTLGEPADYSNPALSPDEKSLAVGRQDPQRKTRDVWIFDLVRGTSTRLTFDPADDTNPAWSPDGTRIAFTCDRRGVREIYQKMANGSGDVEMLLESKEWASVEDWSPDGSLLLYKHGGGDREPDLHLLPLSSGRDRKALPFLATRFSEHMGQFAPSGRWIAYCSNESGRTEVYVQSLSGAGASARGKWQVSTAGGLEPRWRGDGRELFYLSGSTLMAVDVKADGGTLQTGIPRPLFDARLPEWRRNRYVVARDGQRFLVNTAVERPMDSPIHVLVNWLPSAR